MNRERRGFGGGERERYEQGEVWVWMSRSFSAHTLHSFL